MLPVQVTGVGLVGGLLVLDGGIQTDLATAELWDPNTGSWTATGSLGVARRNHTATLLSDGRVLVAGGVVDNLNGTISALATAGIFKDRPVEFHSLFGLVIEPQERGDFLHRFSHWCLLCTVLSPPSQ